MARITLPTPEIGPNAGIPFTGLLYGLQFVDGVADAEVGEHLAQSMIWQGATIETTAAEYGTPDEPAPVLADLTVHELRTLALERDVDLGGATKKAAIIAILEDAAAPVNMADMLDDVTHVDGVPLTDIPVAELIELARPAGIDIPADATQETAIALIEASDAILTLTDQE